MWSGDEKKLKLQARFNSMSGKEAKKAIKKKRQKIAQKEKKSRPFSAGGERSRSSVQGFPVGQGNKKRTWGAMAGGGSETARDGPRKRRRV
jgi:ribosomal RNA-processing protein 36